MRRTWPWLSLGAIAALTWLSACEPAGQNQTEHEGPSAQSAARGAAHASLVRGGRDLTAADPALVGISAERLGHLSQAMQSVIDGGEVAGLVTMVARHGKVVHFEARGKRDIEGDLPMEKDTIFRIASMTKPITGVAMMILYEEGKWQLDDPVSKYVPEFTNLKVFGGTDANGNIVVEEPDHPMTMRELMSHTGGLTYGYFGDTAIDKLYNETQVLASDGSMQSMIDKLAKIPLLHQPGTQWVYSVSVDIQGYLVEKLSGQPFADFLDARIFAPLGMVDTGFFVPAEKAGRLAVVYAEGEEGSLVADAASNGRDYTQMPGLPSGGGGLLSTASDYMRFCQMLLNGGALGDVRILSPLTVELMHDNHLPAGVVIQNSGGFGGGLEFGLDFGILPDTAKSGGMYGAGTYLWGGAYGTWFWIDPVYDLIMVGMMQKTLDTVVNLRPVSQATIYGAIVQAGR